jgi:hypothetical protein
MRLELAMQGILMSGFPRENRFLQWESHVSYYLGKLKKDYSTYHSRLDVFDRSFDTLLIGLPHPLPLALQPSSVGKIITTSTVSMYTVP